MHFQGRWRYIKGKGVSRVVFIYICRHAERTTSESKSASYSHGQAEMTKAYTEAQCASQSQRILHAVATVTAENLYIRIYYP